MAPHPMDGAYSAGGSQLTVRDVHAIRTDVE